MGNSGSKTITVLGGGLTGLAAAYRLATLGHHVRLYEKGARFGGTIRTERSGGWLVESGPNTFAAPGTECTALVRELGLAEECIEAAPEARIRFLVRQGQLYPLPRSRFRFLASLLFSPGAKLRVLAEWFARRRVRTTDLSLAAFLRSHFGSEVVERAGQPLASGYCAGDPAKLSTRHAFPGLWGLEQSHGSLLRGLLAGEWAEGAPGGSAGRRIFSFRHGLQMLPDALASRLSAGSVMLHARVEGLVPGAQWQVLWHDGARMQTDSCDAVVSTLPAHALARLTFGALGERPLAALETMPHPPVASLFLGFRREQVLHPLDGFGVLVPAVERRSLLGVLFSSTLFPSRAPAGHVALTVLAGGSLQPEMAMHSPEELLPLVLADLRDLLGVSGEPVLVRHTFWPRAIPQYNLGHEHVLEVIAAAERRHPGLFIGGNVRDGIDLPACVAAGEKLARRAAAPETARP